jgi:hypothetical protein
MGIELDVGELRNERLRLRKVDEDFRSLLVALIGVVGN